MTGQEKDIETFVMIAISKELEPLGQKITLQKDGETFFRTDVGFDSLKTVELFMECEKEYGVEFTDEEILKCDTVEKLIAKVKEKLTVSTR